MGYGLFSDYFGRTDRTAESMYIVSPVPYYSMYILDLEFMELPMQFLKLPVQSQTIDGVGAVSLNRGFCVSGSSVQLNLYGYG